MSLLVNNQIQGTPQALSQNWNPAEVHIVVAAVGTHHGAAARLYNFKVSLNPKALNNDVIDQVDTVISPHPSPSNNRALGADLRECSHGHESAENSSRPVSVPNEPAENSLLHESCHRVDRPGTSPIVGADDDRPSSLMLGDNSIYSCATVTSASLLSQEVLLYARVLTFWTQSPYFHVYVPLPPC